MELRSKTKFTAEIQVISIGNERFGGACCFRLLVLAVQIETLPVDMALYRTRLESSSLNMRTSNAINLISPRSEVRVINKASGTMQMSLSPYTVHVMVLTCLFNDAVTNTGVM